MRQGLCKILLHREKNDINRSIVLIVGVYWLYFISYGNAAEITEIRKDITTPILRAINSSP